MKSVTELDKLLDHIAFHYPGVPLDAAERELHTLRQRLAAAEAALAKSDPWKEISTEPVLEFRCIHCDNEYDFMATMEENHADGCIWLAAALAAREER